MENEIRTTTTLSSKGYPEEAELEFGDEDHTVDDRHNLHPTLRSFNDTMLGTPTPTLTPLVLINKDDPTLAMWMWQQ